MCYRFCYWQAVFYIHTGKGVLIGVCMAAYMRYDPSWLRYCFVRNTVCIYKYICTAGFHKYISFLWRKLNKASGFIVVCKQEILKITCWNV